MRFAPVLFLPTLLSCAPGVPGTGHADDACTVAVRFTESWLGGWEKKPIVLADVEEAYPPKPIAGRWLDPSGAAGEAPSPAMLKAGAALPKESAVARCPALRAYLDQSRIPHGAVAVKAVVGEAPKAEDSYPAAILDLTVLTVSPDGTEALLATGTTFGPEAGGGEIYYLKRRSDGRWRVVSSQPSWVS